MTITIQEAATRLDVTPATLRQQIANGRLAATKFGRDWAIEEAEVERYRSQSRGRPGRRFAADEVSESEARVLDGNR